MAAQEQPKSLSSKNKTGPVQVAFGVHSAGTCDLVLPALAATCPASGVGPESATTMLSPEASCSHARHSERSAFLATQDSMLHTGARVHSPSRRSPSASSVSGSGAGETECRNGQSLSIGEDGGQMKKVNCMTC